MTEFLFQVNCPFKQGLYRLYFDRKKNGENRTVERNWSYTADLQHNICSRVERKTTKLDSNLFLQEVIILMPKPHHIMQDLTDKKTDTPQTATPIVTLPLLLRAQHILSQILLHKAGGLDRSLCPVVQCVFRCSVGSEVNIDTLTYECTLICTVKMPIVFMCLTKEKIKHGAEKKSIKTKKKKKGNNSNRILATCVLGP